MYNKTFSIGDVLEQGWGLFKKYWMMALLILGASIITDIVSSLFSPIDADDLQDILHSNRLSDRAIEEILDDIDFKLLSASKLIETIIQSIIMVGLIRMVFFIIKGVKDELSFDAFNVPISTYVKYIVTDFLVNLLTGIGLLFCIIPGIVIGIRLQFATYCLLDDQELGIIESIKMSWNMTSGNFWRLFGFILLSICIILLGLLCCCIGIFAAFAWLLFADILIYFALKPDTITPDETSYIKDERQ